MDDLIHATRARIAELGRLMYERYLTDASGGNISARVGDLVCITPATQAVNISGGCARSR